MTVTYLILFRYFCPIPFRTSAFIRWCNTLTAIVFRLEKYNIDNNVLLFRQTRGLGSMTTQTILMFDVSNNNYFVVYWFVVALLYLFWRIAICFFDFGVLNANHVFLSYFFPISSFIRCWYALMAIVFCIEKYNIVNKLFYYQTSGKGWAVFRCFMV